jgi:hypothetical protein
VQLPPFGFLGLGLFQLGRQYDAADHQGKDDGGAD